MNRATTTERVPDAAEAVQRLLEVADALRRHCRWTARLTHRSLVEFLVEESYELLESIEDGHPDEALRGELADVLFQVVLHARIAEERGAFGFADVVEELTEKMVRRNRHVFAPDGTLRGSYPDSVEEIIRGWDLAKRAERPADAGPFDSLPRHLPALALAAKALDRAERWGAVADPRPGPDDFVATDPAATTARGPADAPVPDRPPAPASTAHHGAPRSEDELGELLLDIVRAARRDGLDAERALRTAVVRFTEGERGTGPRPGLER
ncbi:MazG nucleotide pyrophosphohydrolase domain-containing protein [Zafaria sp. Z1313]|uniref:MazG nucleotide pyrophosphohydrolase domain-containing protein n=1 Tax=unclassified Zafaria TaxID=2828765 RepID=UPI002E7866AC|nr:MazG nucleotide pyrophosphohydrolase domain-containing protein [Zafaria sp. J156]MEE1619905.1 MazG nucleotide pyrophosphohydrolase domain-containing protein [Zafaria sp. J156]